MQPGLYWIIKENNEHYIGLCFSSKGLFACTIPYPSFEELKESISRYNLTDEIQETGADKDLEEVLNDLIWKIWIGKDPTISNQIPIDFSGYSSKQIAVYKKCMGIPRGEVLSYGQLAEKSGFPNAARYVGTTMAQCRLPLIIPCHRVVRANGRPGGSSDDARIRMLLLQREGYSRPRKKRSKVNINII